MTKRKAFCGKNLTTEFNELEILYPKDSRLLEIIKWYKEWRSFGALRTKSF